MPDPKTHQTIQLLERNIVLGLSGLAYLDMESPPSLEELVPLVENALGIKLDVDREGINEEIFAYTARILGADCVLYQEPETSPAPYRGRVVVDFRPVSDPLWLGMTEFQHVDVEISDYLAATLRKMTGLPFRAV